MKARLGVDHWVKCIGLHVRASLREMSRKFPHSSLKRDDLMEHWSIPGLMGGAPLPTQIQIVCVHAFWSKYFEKARPDDSNKISNFKKTLLRMEGHCLAKIKECDSSSDVGSRSGG